MFYFYVICSSFKKHSEEWNKIEQDKVYVYKRTASHTFRV